MGGCVSGASNFCFDPGCDECDGKLVGDGKARLARRDFPHDGLYGLLGMRVTGVGPDLTADEGFRLLLQDPDGRIGPVVLVVGFSGGEGQIKLERVVEREGER